MSEVTQSKLCYWISQGSNSDRTQFKIASFESYQGLGIEIVNSLSEDLIVLVDTNCNTVGGHLIRDKGVVAVIVDEKSDS